MRRQTVLSVHDREGAMDPQELKRTTLRRVPDDRAFWTVRGERIDDIRDLAACVESLSPEEFAHHVSVEGKRNDFAVWIQDVLHNPVLAHDLEYPINLNNQQHFAKTVRDHVAWLESV